MQQKRYWLREGVIGFFVGIFIVLISFLVSMNNEPPAFYSMSIIDFFREALLLALQLSVLGVVVGLINGKIKNRNIDKNMV